MVTALASCFCCLMLAASKIFTVSFHLLFSSCGSSSSSPLLFLMQHLGMHAPDPSPWGHSRHIARDPIALTLAAERTYFLLEFLEYSDPGFSASLPPGLLRSTSDGRARPNDGGLSPWSSVAYIHGPKSQLAWHFDAPLGRPDPQE